jgi:hypothetical protein
VSSASSSAIGQSSESFSCSTSRIAAAEVIAFVIEAIQNTVSAVIADPVGAPADAQNAIGGLDCGCSRSPFPPIQRRRVFPGMAKKWGLGFMISTEVVPGGRNTGSRTWAGLGNTYFWIDPARGVAG